jgi:hypothetical protein
MKELKELLLQAPDGQLDSSLHPLIQAWDEEPTSLQVLEVLDQAVYAGLVSDFVLSVLNYMLEIAIAREKTTYEAVVQQATWRNE